MNDERPEKRVYSECVFLYADCVQNMDEASAPQTWHRCRCTFNLHDSKFQQGALSTSSTKAKTFTHWISSLNVVCWTARGHHLKSDSRVVRGTPPNQRTWPQLHEHSLRLIFRLVLIKPACCIKLKGTICNPDRRELSPPAPLLPWTWSAPGLPRHGCLSVVLIPSLRMNNENSHSSEITQLLCADNK